MLDAMKLGLNKFLVELSPVAARDDRLIEGSRLLRLASACFAERNTSSCAATRSGRRDTSVAGRLVGMESLRFGNVLDVFNSAAGYLPSKDSSALAALSR